MTTLPLLNRTLAVLRSPELGFFGFVMPVLRHTPFICGRLTSAGERGLRARCSTRHPRRTWLKVACARGVLKKCLFVSAAAAIAAVGVRKTGVNREGAVVAVVVVDRKTEEVMEE